MPIHFRRHTNLRHLGHVCSTYVSVPYDYWALSNTHPRKYVKNATRNPPDANFAKKRVCHLVQRPNQSH